jgi:hypothetical protein
MVMFERLEYAPNASGKIRRARHGRRRQVETVMMRESGKGRRASPCDPCSLAGPATCCCISIGARFATHDSCFFINIQHRHSPLFFCAASKNAPGLSCLPAISSKVSELRSIHKLPPARTLPECPARVPRHCRGPSPPSRRDAPPRTLCASYVFACRHPSFPTAAPSIRPRTPATATILHAPHSTFSLVHAPPSIATRAIELPHVHSDAPWRPSRPRQGCCLGSSSRCRTTRAYQA